MADRKATGDHKIPKYFFKINSDLTRNLWVLRRPDKRGRYEVSATDLQLLFRKNENNIWGGGYFEFIELRASSITERKQEPENVSSTEESDQRRPSANFPIVALMNYDIVQKTIRYNQVNHVIDRPKTKNAKAEEDLKEAELNTFIYKISVGPKSLQLRICLRNNQKEGASEEFSPTFS